MYKTENQLSGKKIKNTFRKYKQLEVKKYVYQK